MTSILKSDNTTKNGIILKEVAKKFEEATSTSGCDLEMSEITSSMPNSLSLISVDNCANIVTNATVTVSDDTIDENVKYVKVNDEVSSDIEDVIDGFSVFSFVTEDDLIKFSIKSEKIDAITESENMKCKKIAKTKKQNKFNKVTKELSCTEDGIDIYDFQGNSESSPSSKNSSVNFKKSLGNKKFSATKYMKKFKHKFKNAGDSNNLSPSEENSSSTSVTESQNNLLTVGDGRNESPRPTSNDDNNVVSTTTPDNGNIKLEKSDLIGVVASIDKIQTTSLRSPLKAASLRLYKLEDELSSSGQSLILDNNSDTIVDQQVSTFYASCSDNVKVYNNQSQSVCNDEKYQSKIVPTKFSVDLLTKITDKQTVIDDSDKFHGKTTNNFDWNNTRKSPSVESAYSVQPSSISGTKHIVFDTSTVVTCSGSSRHSANKMISMTSVKPGLVSNGCPSVESFKEGSVNSNGSGSDSRTMLGHDNHIIIDDDSTTEKIANKTGSTNSPMQSWLELHAKGLIFQQHNAPSHSNVQSNSSATTSMPPKSVSNSSFNHLNSFSHNSHSTSGTKSQHESALLDWKTNYLDNTKLLSNSVPKFNQNFGSLSHELANNIRYQQEQQELMNALRMKHENSKIPKPLVHMGLDTLYKDHSSYKNPESRFQTPAAHNYFMPNSQLPTDFNTANVFKTRSDPRCHQNSLESSTNKDSFTKTLSSLSASNFKTPETVKRRGQWCDMHVKIAYFIFRSQRRMNMLKSQELNSQLSHLMYSQKLPATSPVLAASPYPSGYLPHSSPYLDYRSTQIKPDHPGYLNYQSKSSANAFLGNPQSVRPINPYHSMMPSQTIDIDSLQTGNQGYEDHHMSPEQKWLRLLSQYMTNYPLTSSVDRPNPEILSQLYLWYQQLSQSSSNNNPNNNSNNPLPHFNSQPPPSVSSTLDPNAAYLRKYMEQFSCLGSLKPDSCSSYMNNSSLSERDMQMYLLKQQQQYQKALLSKYQSSTINKSSSGTASAMNHNINPLLINNNSSNQFYTKKLMEMKALGAESLLTQYPDCVQSLVNQKYRLSQDQLRHIKQQESLTNHHSRNGFSKMPDSCNPKRRKLNSESLKTDLMMSNCDKDDAKSVTDLTIDYATVGSHYNNNNNNNNNSITTSGMGIDNKSSTKSRENINYHLQTVIPDSKE